MLAYDSNRRRLVLHGGPTSVAGTAGALADTWEWDGGAWTQRQVAGPPLRVHAVAAFNRASGRVVLHGGVDAASRLLTDTWEWDGRAWAQRSNGGPSGCIPSGMVYEPARRTVLMLCLDGAHPRADGTYESQLWEWSGAWLPIGSRGPVLRPIQPMASFGAADLLLLDGGAPQTSVTWRWEGAEWARLEAAGPAARTAHARAFDAARRRAVLFGGGTTGRDFADTWEWDGARWLEVNLP